MTLQDPSRRLRFATRIEAACAIFSREALRLCAPTFDAGDPSQPDVEREAGWAARLGEPFHRFGIVDETVVRLAGSGGRPDARRVIGAIDRATGEGAA